MTHSQESPPPNLPIQPLTPPHPSAHPFQYFTMPNCPLVRPRLSRPNYPQPPACLHNNYISSSSNGSSSNSACSSAISSCSSGGSNNSGIINCACSSTISNGSSSNSCGINTACSLSIIIIIIITISSGSMRSKKPIL